jgi:Tfp pilus assembly protein PilF
MRGPVFVSGRVLTELGRAATEPVSVELNCGMRPVQVIHTDLGGYFTFTLGGGGFQSNIDFSASNESPQSFGSSMNNLPSRFGGNSLAGCELRVSVAGYHPLSHTITQHSDMGRVEVGTLRLTRIAAMKGTGISVTSLMVPKEASKEFERALKELQNNKPEKAVPHLEKAVAVYDKFAAAWHELGRIYQSRGLQEKAVTAFEAAIGADPEYIPPLLSMATIHIQNREWEKGGETAGKVLALDHSIGFASFLQAVSSYNMNNLEAAERSAQEADKDPNAKLPQVHALLAQIYLQRQDYPQAASQMRTYLQESPDGQFAEQMRQDLAEIEQWVDEEPKQPASAPAESAEPAPGL